MASTHFGDLGVYLWSNKTVYIHISLPALPSDFEPKLMNLPTTKQTSEGKIRVLVRCGITWYYFLYKYKTCAFVVYSLPSNSC